MRKFIAALLIAATLVCLAAPALASWTGYVTSTGLYIREKPSSSAKALKCPKNGAALTILEEKGDWYYVKYGVVYGYVSKKYVSSKKTSDSSSSASSGSTKISEKTIAELGSAPKPMREGDRGSDVVKLQKALVILGYLSGKCDGIYGGQTTAAVKKYQRAKGLTADGIAGNGTIRCIFGSTSDSGGSNNGGSSSGKVQKLKWFNTGYNLMNSISGSFSILDCNTGVTWKAKYINGTSHADVIPASESDYSKIKSFMGSYVRRPVIVTIGGVKYAGSMYLVAHGDKDYCSYFDGVVCIHFTGSKTHGSGNVDADHQAAIQRALKYYD